MEILGFAAIGVAVFITGLWLYGRRPAVYRNLTPDRVERLLNVLLLQGHDGGAMFVRGNTRFPFLQVMKYAGRGKVGLQLDFPKTAWSEPFLSKVTPILIDFGAESTIGAPGYRNELQFITVDFGTNVKRAAQCLTRVAQDGLGLQLSVTARAYFEKVSSDPNARIGF